MLELALRSPLPDFALDVALEVPAGRRLAVLGPSGAGKSTLLRCVAGLRRPASGTVRCGGAVWFDRTRRIDLPPERRGCGVLFQSYALFDHLTARGNVAFGVAADGRAARRREADAWLERLGLGRAAGRRPAELSGGERQRVALARTLAARPRALLLDEPLSALDVRTRAGATRELVATLDALEVPVLVVTHDATEAALLAGDVAVLEEGEVVQRGPAASLAAGPATAFVAELVGAVVLRGTGRPDGSGTRVELDGGGVVLAGGRGEGRVAVTFDPWDVALAREVDPAGGPGGGSARNALAATVTSVTIARDRVRVGLAAPQPFTAEITPEAAAELDVGVGDRLRASWKATATRVLPR